MKCETCGNEVEPCSTVTIDCDGCWKAAAAMLNKLKQEGKKLPALGKQAVEAFKRLKITVEY